VIRRANRARRQTSSRARACQPARPALWLAGEIAGEGRAKAIRSAIEYDPQPPFDSGHMSKASATTKAAATRCFQGQHQTGQHEGHDDARWEQGIGGRPVAATPEAAGKLVGLVRLLGIPEA